MATDDSALEQLKIPPHSREAEQSLLGGLLLDAQTWDEVAGTVTKQDFYLPEHRLIFEAMVKITERGHPLDVLTISEELDVMDEAENAGGVSYLSELAASASSASNVKAYAEIIRDRAVLRQLIRVAGEMSENARKPAGRSVGEILDEADEEDKGKTKVERATGKIEFDDVTFSYPGKQTPALSNVSFIANPGQSIALVGRSGSGKSTISSLLTRFYVPQEGEIRLDDTALNDIDLKDLRAQFAVVSQNVTLFNDTIANNIAYGARQNVSRKDIENAAKMAHVEEFLSNLPDGLDTIIGENGLMLSGGQRQRIAIARAILAEAPILILDEATSALDTESERLIQDALETLQKRCTSIVVAHRLSTIENADCIMVVEQGRIIEKGKHNELLEKGGHYAQLHALQFGETK